MIELCQNIVVSSFWDTYGHVATIAMEPICLFEVEWTKVSSPKVVANHAYLLHTAYAVSDSIHCASKNRTATINMT